ncbi:MAG: hypothetical protein ABEJ72_09645, partial [Candidatus Aenigmatarchaeota archaeon]
ANPDKIAKFETVEQRKIMLDGEEYTKVNYLRDPEVWASSISKSDMEHAAEVTESIMEHARRLDLPFSPAIRNMDLNEVENFWSEINEKIDDGFGVGSIEECDEGYSVLCGEREQLLRFENGQRYPDGSVILYYEDRNTVKPVGMVRSLRQLGEVRDTLKQKVS